MNEILIYGDIGFEVSPSAIVAQLQEATGPVDVRVDSFGGDVYAGISIMNALRRYPDFVTVHVDGIAASAASYIAVGGADKLVMSPNSSLLVHGAWTNVAGNSADFFEAAENLTRITENIASIYAEKSGKATDFWLEVMKKDTTYSADEAVAIGLADEVAESKKSVHAQHRQMVMASHRSRFRELTGSVGVPEIANRSAAPPSQPVRRSVSVDEKIQTPSNGQEGHSMNVLNELARELGKKPEDVQRALSGFFNEALEVTTPVAVNYPDEVTVVPTGKVEVEPDTELPEGVEVTVEAPDNFTAEVGEGGKVAIRASDAVSVGDTADVVLTVGEASVTVKVTVVAADEDGEKPAEGEAPAAEPAPVAPAPEAVTLDRDTYNELIARAELGAKAHEEAQVKARVAEVEKWVAEGRISAAVKAKALSLAEADMDAARRLYGSNPVNTIPRVEVGYGRDLNDEEVNTVPTAEELRKRSAARRAAKK